MTSSLCVMTSESPKGRHSLCNNKLVTTELVVQCRKSLVTYGVTGMKDVRKRKVRSKKIKCVKVRALFPENKVRFALAEQLC